MAYKVFSNGDALTGGELNTFLMNQSVISFATTTARDAALTAPLEGQLVWLEDSNKYVYYSGSAWVDLIVPASSGNAIINGAFDIWQRGTSFSNPTSTSYTADRFRVNFDGTGATRTISQQTFTPGTAPVSGYESAFHLRYACTVAGSGNTFYDFIQPIEDVRSFAGQTITVSFWAKAASAVAMSRILLGQVFGSGGSGAVYTTVGTAPTLTTSWARYSFSVAVPSISGKTIGTSSALELFLGMPTAATATVDIWGVQLEAGSTATPFRRNANSIQGELAACQRYYIRFGGKGNSNYAMGSANGSTNTSFVVLIGTSLRIPPTSVEFSAGLRIADTGGSTFNLSAMSIDTNRSTQNTAFIYTTHSSGATQYRNYFLENNNNDTQFFALSSEL
jgi:hypothetical protein